MNRTSKEEELKRVYNVTDDTMISVKSSALLGHLSLLGRHEKGNEDRIEKLRYIVGQLSSKTHFANKVDMSIMDLLQVYNVAKKIDYERAKEILQADRREKDADSMMKSILCQTKRLPQKEELQLAIKKGMVLNILNRQYILLPNKREWMIGRAPDADIFINEKGVSRKHCKLFWKTGKLMIKDLNSTNGTYVNNIKIDQAFILDDSFIRIGSIEGHLQNIE